MLKEIAPSVQRAALIGNPDRSDFDYFLQVAETLAPSLAIKIVPVRVGNIPIDIERAIETFAVSQMEEVLPPDGTTIQNRDLIVGLAARHRLPAVYAFRFFVTAGGLMSYMLLISSIRSPSSGRTLTASCAAPIRPTCRCKRPPSTKPLSISGRRKRWAWRYRPAYS